MARGGIAQMAPQTDAVLFRLSLPPDASYIGVSRMFAASIARHFECPEEVVEDVKIAISEACTNAVKAHRDASIVEPIVLNVRGAGQTLAFELVDNGPGFELLAPHAETITPVAGLYEGSLGLSLIRALFPGAEIVRNAERGMTVRFTVELSAAIPR